METSLIIIRKFNNLYCAMKFMDKNKLKRAVNFENVELEVKKIIESIQTYNEEIKNGH